MAMLSLVVSRALLCAAVGGPGVAASFLPLNRANTLSAITGWNCTSVLLPALVVAAGRQVADGVVPDIIAWMSQAARPMVCQSCPLMLCIRATVSTVLLIASVSVVRREGAVESSCRRSLTDAAALFAAAAAAVLLDGTVVPKRAEAARCGFCVGPFGVGLI